VAERAIRRLDADRNEARRELVTVLGQARYDVLVKDLESTARQPPCTSAAYVAPATKVAPAVRRPWRKLRRAVEQLGDRPSDEALHHVRVLAKRCRYAAEACIPAFGKPARRFAKAVEAVQEVLGEQHDAVVASTWLAKTAHECSPAEAYAVGMLAEVERASAESARAAFPPAWKVARRRRLRTWL
jgi:CHAD domain-containing protein